MSRKIIIAGACTLLTLAAMRFYSGLALAERGYSATGGEIIAVPIIVFCAAAAVRTAKDVIRGWKRG